MTAARAGALAVAAAPLAALLSLLAAPPLQAHFLLDGRAPRMSGYARASVACASIAVAALWAGTRSVALLRAMQSSA